MDPDSHTVTVSYLDGQSVVVPVGTTVLAASHAAQIPHSALCGGRGRCSSCRVRVLGGSETLAAPDKAEEALLSNIANWSPDIRLACRLRVQSDTLVEPIVAPQTGQDSPEVTGRLVQLTVMFIDIRGFSRMSAKMHPFDVVFMLNRFFDVAGHAIAGAGGLVDKFMGDGVMALFGIDQDPIQGARQSLVAARDIARALHGLNSELSSELTEPLRIGIGVHCGSAIVGRFGWGKRAGGEMTAIGDVVNIASRLETATKTLGCQLLMSEAVAVALKGDRFTFQASDIELPNYVGRVSVRAVKDACALGV